MDCKENCLHCTDKCNTKSNTNQHGNSELKDEEIVKALEHCSSSDLGECRNCPFYEQCENDEQLVKYTLDLINRLQVKNKEFDEKLVIQRGLIDRQKAEIERLHFLLKDNWARIEELDKLNETAKSEAIKEFAERLKAKFNHSGKSTKYGEFTWDDVTSYEIDNLVKEMTGD